MTYRCTRINPYLAETPIADRQGYYLGQPLPESPVAVKPAYNHKIEPNNEKTSEINQSLVNHSPKRAIATTLYLSAQKKFAL